MAVELRDKTTAFALTGSEKERLKRACEKRGMRMSDYIRDIVLERIKKDEK